MYDFLSLKNDVNVTSKSNKQKKIISVTILKGTEENTPIRIRIRGKDPRIRIPTKMSRRNTDSWSIRRNVFFFVFLTQENGAQAAEGELKPRVQNPGRKEEDDAGVLLPHGCRLNNVEEDFKCRLCLSYPQLEFEKYHSFASTMVGKN